MNEKIKEFIFDFVEKLFNFSRINLFIDNIFAITFYPAFKNLKYNDFNSKPIFVKIENTNLCNAKCLYCPHKYLKRKKGFMKKELFKKIVDECVNWKIKEIHLCNFGEPLLDKEIVDKIKYIKKFKIKTVIFTNGSLLNKNISKKIMEAGLDELWISYDGFSKKHFEKYRYPLKYEVVKKNIENVIRIKEKWNFKTKIILQPVFDKTKMNIKYLYNFKKLWLGKVDRINIQKIHDWHGTINNNVFFNRLNSKIFCLDAFQYMTINWDGTVVPCCLDYEAEHIMGDVNKQTLRDIWFGKKFKRFRKTLIENINSIEMCKNCKIRLYNSYFPHIFLIFWLRK
ncbi:MAG: SPASM domain-containing protein [Candidatus Methanomethylicia archaeon]